VKNGYLKTYHHAHLLQCFGSGSCSYTSDSFIINSSSKSSHLEPRKKNGAGMLTESDAQHLSSL